MLLMSATTAPSKRDEPGGGNSSEVYYNEKLGCGLSCAYGFFRVPVSAYDLAVRPARTAVYIEALNHSIIIHAMTVALCKSFDFLLGFVVGTASDNTPTRWGRRKPWVVVCFPLGCLSAFFLLYPIPWVGNVLVTTDSTAPCASVAADNATSCDALRVCIDAAIANGSLPAPDSASHDVALQATRGDASVGLSVWFGAWYFTYYFFSWTCTMIPYDALGMELTSDYKARVSLFSIKAGFHFSGYVLPNICGFVLARIFPTNIVAVYAYTAVILAVFGVAALLVLGCCVTERPSAKEGKGKSVPPVVALRRALSNRPYLIYLAIKFPIALFGLMPINLLSYFLRYGMLMENWADTYFLGLIVGLFVSVLSIPAVWALARRFGKREILLWFSAFGVPILIAIFFIPPASMPVAVLYVIVCISAIFAVLSFVVLDAMLADIIDYDTLRTGKRSEAVYAARAAAREGRPRLSPRSSRERYTVAETNLQQFMEIIGGVVPLLILSATGFENNGGCSCGCGVACDADYLRWSCPGDVGYSCTGAFDAPPLFGDAERLAPCLLQKSDGVVWTLRVLLFAFTAFLLGLSTFAAKLYPISNAKHRAILEATEAMGSAGAATDPLTDRPIVRRADDEQSLIREHFSPSELRRPTQLRLRVAVRLGVWLAFIVALIVAMGATSGETQMNVITLGAILCAGGEPCALEPTAQAALRPPRGRALSARVVPPTPSFRPRPLRRDPPPGRRQAEARRRASHRDARPDVAPEQRRVRGDCREDSVRARKAGTGTAESFGASTPNLAHASPCGVRPDS